MLIMQDWTKQKLMEIWHSIVLLYLYTLEFYSCKYTIRPEYMELCEPRFVNNWFEQNPINYVSE